jgi:ribosome-associated protein
MEIPFSEFTITFVRSGGPGGQNVNKVNTKAQLRFKVGESRVLSIEQKARVRIKLANRLNKNDEIIVYADSERSQAQNKNKAVELLNTLVANAIKLPKKRRATKPTKSSKEKRLLSKTRRSKIKQNRGNNHDEW